MTCSNQCIHYKATKPMGASRYAKGQKYCSYCAVYMEIKDRNCPCCHYQLKMHPRSKKYKPEPKRI